MLTDEIKYQILQQFTPIRHENVDSDSKKLILELLEDDEFQMIITTLTMDIMSANINLLAQMEYSLDEGEETIFDTVNNMTAYYKIKRIRLTDKIKTLLESMKVKVDTSEVCFCSGDNDMTIIILQLTSGILGWIYKSSGMSNLGRPIDCSQILLNLFNDLSPDDYDEFEKMCDTKLKVKLDKLEMANTKMISNKISTSVMAYAIQGLKNTSLIKPKYTEEYLDQDIEVSSNILDKLIQSKVNKDK